MNKGNVLFVDDEKMITNLLKSEFSDEEYGIHFANSAKEAFEILESIDIDVIVSDMIMPDMNGLELLSIVRYKYPHVVRIILSGYSQVNAILSAINEGEIYRYITKPWKVDQKAKKTIRDALEYAKFLKNSTKKDINAIDIYYNKFIAMLNSVANSFLVCDIDYNIKDKNNIDVDVIDDNSIEKLMNDGYKFHEISNNLIVILK
ncbi:response regulator [Peptostreptococcaceae bacterium AGR-M142]